MTDGYKPLGNRILLLGSAGAGKTTLSKKLGQLLELPVYHLDKYFWKDWKECPDDEWDRIVTDFTLKERWIIDGNYFRTLDIRLSRADTVVFLDYPTFTCLWGVTKRVLANYGKQREDMGEGCPERFDWDFMRWVYSFKKAYRPYLFERLKHYENLNIIVLKNRKSADKLLSEIGNYRNV